MTATGYHMAHDNDPLPENMEDMNLRPSAEEQLSLDQLSPMTIVAGRPPLMHRTDTNSRSPNTLAAKWYFHQIEDNNNILELQCPTSHQPPILVPSSKGQTEWSADISSLLPGFYDMVIGVSTRGINTEMIESIAFSMHLNNQVLGASETIIDEEFRRMCVSEKGIHNWRLHGQLHKITINNDSKVSGNGSSSTLTVRMVITVLKGTPPSADAGYLGLHYMELHCSDSKSNNNERWPMTHHPYQWSLDIKDTGDHSKGNTRHTPRTILAVAISGNGQYLATVATTNDSLTHLLSVWERTTSTDQLAREESIISIQSQQELPFNILSVRPNAHAEGVLSLKELRDGSQRRNVRVSLSWDGSMVAVAEQDINDPYGASNFFEIYHNDSYPTTPATIATLRPSNKYKRVLKLNDFRGYGRFHVTENVGQDIDQELFIACQKDELLIFSVHPKWCHLHTIKIGPQAFDMHISGCPSHYLAVMEPKYGILSVWDIEQRSLTSLVQPGRKDCLAADIVAFSNVGHIMAVAWDKDIALHWISSGSPLGTFTLPSGSSKVNNLRFLEDDSQLLVNFDRDNGNHIMEAVGVILQTDSMTVVDHFVIPQACTARIEPAVGSGIEFLSVHESTLDLVTPYTLPRLPCTQDCTQALTPLDECHHIITVKKSMDYLAPSGLNYNIKMFDELNSPPTFEVSICGQDAREPKKFDIRFSRQHFNPERAFFLEGNLRLVVIAGWYTVIWQLPTTMNDDLKLNVVTYQMDRRHYSTCLHQELYNQHRTGDNQPRHIGYQFHNTGDRHFEREIHLMIATYQVADEACRKAILQYIGPNLNSHCDLHHPDNTFISTLCHWWVNVWHLDEDESHNQFLSDLLASPASQWILRPDTPLESNPLSILLEAANERPRAMQPAKVLIEHCFQNARAEKEVGHLFPVLQCLGTSVDPKGLHTDLGTETLERLKCLPVKNREYLIDHHNIAHPPELRLDFWRSSKRPLYKCKDPILQLADDVKLHDLNEYFKGELCVAPFSMLWRYHDDVQTHTAPSSNPSWIHVLLSMVWYKCKPRRKKMVEPHNFSQEMLDNPAIIALIDYKWNTIGFRYCMARFVSQCCYYALILTVVFLQVYGNYHGTLFGVFIAIAVLSVIFLWLELIQLIRDWRHYITSLYNLADLIVFGLPLAASINHFFILSGAITGHTPDAGNAGLLSFSVVFVFLHLLFEFRISKSICKFVTIIIHAFVKIRMFFILFAGGIISFTIAVLHLLHSCPFKMCVEPDPPTSFPTHFYGAISATFFYMGGRYNSVDKEFDSKNWAFQTLMITSYFFMVVLMLNVLIALINNAFSDGEATWRATWLDNRLRVIEAVENLSYYIPGLREHSDWFPDEIYYSVQGKQIEVYQANELEKLTNSTDGRNDSSTTLSNNVNTANAVNSVSKMKNPFPQSPRGSISSKLPLRPRSSFSPILSPKLMNSFYSEMDADAVGAVSERSMNELSGELKQARNQIVTMRTQLLDQKESITMLQDQNMMILEQMKIIQVLLGTPPGSNVVPRFS